MAAAHAGAILRQLHRLVGSRAIAGKTDSQLLQDYTVGRREEAFAALLHRHGRLVWSVCRHMLPHEHDAEDAFQATFLVLARRAASIRRTEAVASWLHGTAYRIARKARAVASRRNRCETPLKYEPPAPPVSDLAWRELQAILDEELQRLPEKYRSPFILCCLEGRSRAEAAAELGWKEGTLSSRIAHARALLQERLTRRGVMLSAALMAGVMWNQPASAALMQATQKAAAHVAAGQAVSAVSTPTVAALVESAVDTVGAKAKLALVVLLAGIIGGTLGLVSSEQPARTVQESKGEAKATIALPKADSRPTKTDLYGDALPEGAIARLGSSRLRHAGEMQFSADGKQLISWGRDRLIRRWDVATGKQLGQEIIQTVKSSSSGWFLVADKVVQIVDQNVYIREATTPKELHKIPLTEKIYIERCAASSDGKFAAIAFRDDSFNDGSIYLWNIETGEQKVFAKVGVATHVTFSRDAKLLVAAGIGVRPPEIRFWDVATGKKVNTLETEALCFALAPDGKTLATGSFNGLVRLWDIPTRKELAVLALASKPQFSCLSFSPDGKWLAAGGTDDLRLWDVATKKQVHDFPGQSAYQLVFSPDSKLMGGSAGGAIRIWDLATGKDLHPRPGHGSMAIFTVFSPDGKLAASIGSGESWIRLWDAASGKPLQILKGHERQPSNYSFTKDGKRLLSAAYDGTVRLWDIAHGKEVRAFRGKQSTKTNSQGACLSVSLSTDGKNVTAVTLLHDTPQNRYHIETWDTETGKLLLSRPFDGDQGSDFTPGGWGVTRWTESGILIEEPKTGRRLSLIAGPLSNFSVFSQDGKVFAAPKHSPHSSAGSEESPRFEDGNHIAIAETTTGKLIRRIDSPVAYYITLSPDGQVLAGANGQGFRLWDVGTGKEIYRRARRVDKSVSPEFASPNDISFLPNGRSLATSLTDGTILIWDVSKAVEQVRPTARNLARPDLAELWEQLASDEAHAAFRAIHQFGASPVRASSFLREHLKPVEAVESKRLDKLFADLDSERFDVRDAAAKELTKHGEQVEPALRRVLEGQPSEEVRRRIEAILGRSRAMPSGEQLRTLRAIQTLELIGTPEANDVLRKLAEGAPAARETREAKASLERLNRNHAEK